MLTPRRILVAATILLLGAPPAVGEPIPRFQPVAPELRWDGPQFVQADAKGNVFLLRARELEVFPVLRNGDVGEPQLLFSDPVEGGLPVTRGVMSEPGEWFVRQGYTVRWFRNGKELPLPEARWPATSLGVLKGRLVAAVVPAPMGRPAPGERLDLPLVVEQVGDHWSAVVTADDEEAERPRMELMQRHAAHLVVDSRDTLWVGQQYRYLVRRYSAAGRRLLEISVDGGAVRHRNADELDSSRSSLDERRKRLADADRAQVQVNTAVEAIQAMADGRDGRFYFLVHGETDGALALSLDRYDPVRGVLERTPISLQVPGTMTMAAGREGLYVAAFSGKNGRWLATWEDLEAAPWASVEGASINGLDLPPAAEDVAPKPAVAATVPR